MITADATRTRRLELILRQIDSLPTLPVVAAKLLALTTSEHSHAREVIELISCDQALTARILAMCRHADLGVRDEVITIDRAVVLLGFTAIRNAVLSIKVFEAFGRSEEVVEQPDGDDVPSAFDRAAFWRHSLSVAIIAERIARLSKRKDLNPAEAFVCGLLHDIGKLALDHILPRSFARVVELANLNQGNIAEIERRIIGLDHHTAGKRLAEQWQLPHRLADCIWLHGSLYETLPRLEHRAMIGLITLADTLARQHHLGYSGNHQIKQQPVELATALNISHDILTDACRSIHEELERRSQSMGLGATMSRDLFMESIQQANTELGRLNSALQRRSRVNAQQSKVLDAIYNFHVAAVPGRTAQDVLGAVVESCSATFGSGFYATLYPQAASAGDGPSWLICQYDGSGMLIRSQLIEQPPGAPDLSRLDPREPLSMNLASVVPWIADYLLDAPDLRQIQLLPLGCGWGTAALLLHDRAMPPYQFIAPLVMTWGSAVAAAGQHEGERRLGEDLAEANRALAEAQERISRQESMARLGEMAAGAAHEMNNPLAVISGRSQLLAMTLPPSSKEAKAAQTIYEQAHRLSDLITSLRMFADPPRAERKPTDVCKLLQEVVRRLRHESKDVPPGCQVYMQLKNNIPLVMLDEQQITQAVMELLTNATQATPRHMVQLSAMITPEQALLIQVSDDGVGMDAHVLAHAMDPFFSAKPAGRRVGMGLPRAQQWAQAHDGRIELRSQPSAGTVASLLIPLDSPSLTSEIGR